MAEEYEYPKITLKIVSQKGTCTYGHEVGQEFDVSGTTPGGMCPSAFYSAYPCIMALMVGGSMPWEKDKDTAHIACPDPENPVVMELIREKSYAK
ncbi:MAG: TIGR04076 family protein [Thermodesulfobacteriota bacterium]